MNPVKLILSGIVFAVIAQIIHSLEAIATMGYYLKPEYFAVWSKIMMPKAGAPPTEFYALSILFAIVSGILYAIVFRKIQNSLPGKTLVKKGSFFGVILFLAAGIPSALSMILLINLPLELIVSWAFTSLIIYIIGGIAIAKIIGK